MQLKSWLRHSDVASRHIGIFAALLPKILHNLEIAERLTWQFSSAFLATFTFVMFVWMFSRIRKTNALQHQDFSPLFIVLASMVVLPIATLLLISSFGLLFEPSIGIYSMGLAANLFISAGMFVLLIRLVLRNA